MRLAQRPQHSDPVRLEPVAPRSRVKLSTTEPLRSLLLSWVSGIKKLKISCDLSDSHEISKFSSFLSVTSESMCTKYWLTACSSLPRKKCG